MQTYKLVVIIGTNQST